MKKLYLWTMFIVLIVSIGCSKINNNSDIEKIKLSENKIDKNNTKEIENEIPYIDEKEGTIDNKIIDKRYISIDKDDLTYTEPKYSGLILDESEIHYADSIKNDIYYKDILLGFTYAAETNPTNMHYNEALNLIEKVLPDDIEKVNSRIDEEVNKEYIYYKSDKGNFRVGISYGGDTKNKSVNEIHEYSIIGIDYSKEEEK